MYFLDELWFQPTFAYQLTLKLNNKTLFLLKDYIRDRQINVLITLGHDCKSSNIY